LAAAANGVLRQFRRNQVKKGISNMIGGWIVDFDKSVEGAMLLSVEAKMTRADKNNPKSDQVQARDKDNVPKWGVTLALQTKSFENTKFENITITITSREKPYGAIQPGTPVTVEGLALGFMVNARGGLSVFYSAEAIRPLQRVLPSQPARVVAGQ
jgi:hypothetical protein